MEKIIQTIETVQIQERTLLSGYSGDYIFEKIRATGNFYELELLNRWINNSADINVVYDIGANIGNHAIYFALKTNAQVFAFEPMPTNFYLLDKNIQDNNMQDRIIAYNVALGNCEGIAHMSFTQENNNGTASILTSVDNTGEQVNVKVLDNMNLPLPDFIKIDVEGFELNVLKGMRNILCNTRAPLWIEVDEKNAKLVYEFLAEVGYFISDLVFSSDNNVLFLKEESSSMSNAAIFEIFIGEVISKRKLSVELIKQTSKFQFEQKKAEDLYQKLQSMTSKYKYEQKKAEDIYQRLQGMTSKYKYEQKKVEDLKNNLQEVNDEKNQNEKKQKYIEELLTQVEKLQKELLMFQNSKMINIMRFWIWKVPATFRHWFKKKMYKIARWLYIKIMPYPRLRLICSKINGKLNIFKDPETIVSSTNSVKKDLKLKKNYLLKKPKQMNVAMIVDEFTYNSFRFECNVLVLEPNNWKEIFEKNEIDLFFCESAWSGVDSVRRPWKGQIYSSTNFPRENRGTLLQILECCHKKNIPTVFWNKEDPTHYNDKVHNFVDTALKFDHIFTTDNECVKRYKKDYGHKSVHLLMFASQPKLFNPIEKFKRTEEIIFAGSWYNQHKERCVEMENILDSILNSPYTLKIYNRQSDNRDPNHTFPSKFARYIYPRLPHDQLNAAYKGSKFALNINTVTESDTMFARRVFELMSSNTLVISNYSRGMEFLFGDNVVFTDGKENLKLLDTEKKRENCLYNVLQHHTYKNRFLQILNDIGIPYTYTSEQVTIIYEVADLEMADRSIHHFCKIDWYNKKCLLLIDDKCSPEVLQEICIRYNSDTISVCSRHYYNYYDKIQSLVNVSGYIIIANEQLHYDFIAMAMLHYQYLEPETPIAYGKDKYTFEDIETVENVLWPISQYNKINYNQNNIGQKQIAVKVYVV